MKFVPNPNFAAEMATFEQAATKLAADAAKSHAEQIAPVDTGRYEHSFEVEEAEGGHTLGNTDFAAHFVEWGSVNNPAYGTLRRAVQAVGLHLREAPRP